MIGGLAAGRYAHERGLDAAPLYAIGMILVAGAVVGGRVYYLAEHGQLLEPSEWLGTRGFTFCSDSAEGALGLEVAQWTSLALLAAACLGAWLTLGRRAGGRPPPSPARPAARTGPG